MADYPKINGHTYDYSSVEIDIGGTVFTAITSINYSGERSIGNHRGTGSKKRARTRGTYDSSGSITMMREDYYELIASLGDGYMEKSFDVTVLFSETGMPTNNVKLIGCVMTTDSDDNAEGEDPLQTSFDIDIMEMTRNGLRPVLK